METIWVIPVLLLAILCIFCAFKESKTTGLYKAFGVYGRIKAYLALDFTFCGIMFVIASVAGALTDEDIINMRVSPYIGVVLGIALFVLGFLIYWRTYTKCPQPLKSKCISSMLITGMGIALKVGLFFLIFIWKLYEPQRYTTSDGIEIYVDGSLAYDPSTGKSGIYEDGTVYWNS